MTATRGFVCLGFYVLATFELTVPYPILVMTSSRLGSGKDMGVNFFMIQPYSILNLLLKYTPLTQYLFGLTVRRW